MSGKKTSLRTSSSYACIVFVVICSLFLVLTLAVFPTSLSPGLPILLGGILAMLVACYRLGVNSGRYFRKESEIATVLLFWLLVCSFFTLDEYLTRKYLASFVGGIAFLFAAQAGIKSRSHWRWMVYSLVFVSTLVSLHAWLPALQIARATGTLPPLKGTFVNPDTFSILPLVALCLVLGLVERASTVVTLTNLGLASFLLMTVFATGCRASMLGFFVGGATFITSLLRYRKGKTEKTQLLVGFPLLLTLFAIPVVGFKFSFSYKWTRILETNAAEMEAIRFELFQYGWKAILNNPIFGSGPGTFGLSYQTVRPPDHNFMYINIAHNDFLEVGTEAGVPGLLLWFALSWFAFMTPFKLIRKGRLPTEAAAIGGAVVALFTYSMFNFIIVQRPVLWTQLWLFGLALSFPSSRLRTKERKGVRIASSIFLLGMGAWSAIVGTQSLRADALYVQAERAESRLNLEEAVVFYKQAAAQEPPRVKGGLRYVAALDKLQVFGDENNIGERLQILERLREASPHSVPLLITLAETQQSAGRVQEAKATLAQARELTPYMQRLFDAQLVLLLATGDLPGAAEALNQFTLIRWEPTHYQFEKVLFALMVDNPDGGREAAKSWLKSAPEQRGQELMMNAIQLSRKNKEWGAEKALLRVLVESHPENLCLTVQLASAEGKLNGPNSEYNELEKARLQAREQLDPCYDKLLQRWRELSLRRHETAKVKEVLTNYLTVAPNQSWARAQVAEILAESREGQKAIKFLRAGLERSPNDITLVLALARVFEKQGSEQLALNYYREVARLDPGNEEARSKIKKRRKTR
jgi:O-antigen ligase/predicted Zn-dependent protease